MPFPVLGPLAHPLYVRLFTYELDLLTFLGVVRLPRARPVAVFVAVLAYRIRRLRRRRLQVVRRVLYAARLLAFGLVRL